MSDALRISDKPRMSDTWRSWSRAAVTLLAAAVLYEALARSGWFAPALMPTLPKVAGTLWGVLIDGSMIGQIGRAHV